MLSSSAPPISARAAFEAAVCRVVLRQPLLRVGVVGEDTKSPRYVPLAAVDLRECVAWADLGATTDAAGHDAALLRLLEGRHDALWKDLHERPAWQVVIVPVQPQLSDSGGAGGGTVAFDVVFAVHHAFADGKSTQIFHRQLLQALNEPGSAPVPGLASSVLTFLTPPTLPPPQESLVPFSISSLFFLRTLLGEFVPSFLRPSSPSPPPWTGAPMTAGYPYSTRIRLVCVPAPAAKRLLAACRSQKATLTTLLHALVAASLARRLSRGAADSTGGEGDDAAQGGFNTSTAISTRPYVSAVAAEQAGFDREADFSVMVTAHSAAIPAGAAMGLLDSAGVVDDDERVFALAALLREGLAAKLATLPADDIMGLLGWVGDWHGRWRGAVGDEGLAFYPDASSSSSSRAAAAAAEGGMKKKEGKRRDHSWEVSNLGVMKGRGGNGGVNGGVAGQQQAEWSVGRSIFTQSAMAVGPVVGVSVSGVDVGEDGAPKTEVNVALCWQEGVVDEQVMDGLREDLQRWIDVFGKTGTFRGE